MTSARRRTTVGALVLASALALAACSGSADEAEETPSGADDGAETGEAFPVTIDHAFGETVIPEQPERVVAWGWGAADASIALGVTPVAIPFQAYGGDEAGVLPWIREAVEAEGEEIPVVLPDTGEDIPFEEILEAEPDVILAHYSGITEEQYATLSDIAPVVAYPGDPWSTPWREVVTTAGTALGLEAEAQEILDGIDGEIATAREEHPEFEGLSLAAVWDTAGTFYVYADEDPRVEFMLDMGFVNAEAVDSLDTDESPFYFTLSYERLDELESDVLVVYATTEEELTGFVDAPHAQVMPQIEQDAVAPLVGAEFIASVSPPTALSLPWGLDEVVEQLAAAAANAG
ncbi:iron-siderophore ABC transporter substrate-binding protein [Actinotalea sp. C106]|uniref:iron-siderophore ABC transporter substrate-binding protein n=1 Tax=Actinotalea sp. C106 TaxID=2908644 RepID=UPI0020290D55|nr:iron-siderophore ABC transporter substrate-binding protein [Actinotalea sp. C106]